MIAPPLPTVKRVGARHTIPQGEGVATSMHRHRHERKRSAVRSADGPRSQWNQRKADPITVMTWSETAPISPGTVLYRLVSGLSK